MFSIIVTKFLVNCRFLYLTVALGVCALQVNAQVIFDGPCPNVTVEQDFDLTAVWAKEIVIYNRKIIFIKFFQYLGRWYEYKSYFAFFQQNGECVSATYGLNDDATVSVRNYLLNGA